MRKKKEEGRKAVHATVSMPPSFLTAFRGRLSDVLQETMAERITGQALQEVTDVYSELDVRVRRDSAKQELIRAARWILEGDILSLYVMPDHSVRLTVKWKETGVVTVLEVNNGSGGFLRVIYDRELPLHEVLTDAPDTIGEPTDACLSGIVNDLSGYKLTILKNWCKNSPLLEVYGISYEDGDCVGFNVRNKTIVTEG